MPARARRTGEAVAKTASLQDAKAAVDTDRAGGPAHAGARRRGGGADPLLAEVRRGGLLPLLVLRFLVEGSSYGNQLMERVARLTAGAVAVNPNTMYPLLRSLEAKGFILGEWEHPERRSRRFYRVTRAGEAEARRLAAEVSPRLDRMAAAIELIRAELADAGGAQE